MTTMGDDVERSCPLCAEEMDLTDQQLKPCRCGYEICVWCWHHIIEMAEKDDSEARCPACRTAYDKEKIVGTAANCERVVAEVSAERKQKPKAKPKTSSDARKHLNSVRVIQRNLVYVIGLPSNMADENLLERREYFGQYGRVLKVSISRTNGGIQQASSVNTFSVYITYAKEEEAIRCIQATHNFVLEGKTLRACFGTTKYCRAWLRNMTCNNPDCLYLHDVGCQEDSFTKDEVITAYTRSRVPAVGLGSGSGSGNAHRHVGSVLPPPADDLPSSIAVSNSKVVLKASHNSLPLAKSSPLDIGGSGKSAGLPAAASWGHRTNLRAPSLSASSAQGIAQEKSETFGTSSVPPTGGGMSAWHDGALPAGMTGTVEENESQRVPVNGRCRPSESFRSTDKDSHAPMTSPARDISHEQCSSAWSDDECAPVNSPEKHLLTRLNGGPGLVEAFKSSGKDSSLAPDSLPETSSSKERSAWYDGAYTSRDIPEEDHAMRPSSSRASDSSKMFNGNHSQTVSVTSADGCLTNENSAWDDDMGSTAVLASDEHHAGSFRSCSAQAFASDPDLPYEFSVSTSHSSAHVAPEEGNIQGLLPGSESNFDRPAQAVSSSISGGSFSNFNGDIQNLSSHLSILNLDKHSHLGLSYSGACDSVPKVLGECRRSSAGLQHSCTENGIGNLHSRKSFDAELQLRALHIGAHSSRAPCSSGPSLLSEEVSQKSSQSGGDDLLSNSHEEAGSYEEYAKYSGRLHNPPLGKNATLDGGEGNIISNILSMDFDPWSDTSVSTDSFAKFLGEADEHIGRLKMPNLWKGQSNSESRFSFARQESQASFRPSLNEFSHVPTNGSGLHGSTLMDIQNGFASASTRQPMTYIGNQLGILTEKSGGSRTKTSAPPGFSFPSRFQAPPPGFSSQDKLDQAYDGSYSDNHLLGGPSLMKDYQMSPAGYNGDVEFIDPAILAVGKGIDNSGFDSRFTSPSQFNAPDISSRLQLLMQQSVSHQEQRIPDNYSYMSSRHLHQNLPSPSPYGLMATTLQQTRNPQWESWSDVHGNTEILRNKALGLNRFFSGNEETFRAGLNRDFGI